MVLKSIFWVFQCQNFDIQFFRSKSSVFKSKNCHQFGFEDKIGQNVRVMPKVVENLVLKGQNFGYQKSIFLGFQSQNFDIQFFRSISSVFKSKNCQQFGFEVKICPKFGYSGGNVAVDGSKNNCPDYNS